MTGRDVEIEKGVGLLEQIHGEWVAGDATSRSGDDAVADLILLSMPADQRRNREDH